MTRPLRSTSGMTSRRSTRVSRVVKASRERVYRRSDADEVARWRFRPGCRSWWISSSPARVGRFVCRLPTRRPVSARRKNRTDTYTGRFVELVPNELVVEIDEFETDDPSLQGEMRMTISLRTLRAEPRLSVCTKGSRLVSGLLTTNSDGNLRSHGLLRSSSVDVSRPSSECQPSEVRERLRPFRASVCGARIGLEGMRSLCEGVEFATKARDRAPLVGDTGSESDGSRPQLQDRDGADGVEDARLDEDRDWVEGKRHCDQAEDDEPDEADGDQESRAAALRLMGEGAAVTFGWRIRQAVTGPRATWRLR